MLPMLKWIMVAVLALLVFVPRCGFVSHECNFDRDCDGDNPCTKGTCELEWLDYTSGWCTPAYIGRCEISEVGGPCDIKGEEGWCVDGVCRLDDETSEPGLDGGV